jgi:hypothetical protein
MCPDLRRIAPFQSSKNPAANSSKLPSILKMILSSSEGLVVINPSLFVEQEVGQKYFKRLFAHADGFPLDLFSPKPRRYFIPFSKLPAELRHGIWRLSAAEPRVVMISLNARARNPYLQSKTSPPAILHACSEVKKIRSLEICLPISITFSISSRHVLHFLPMIPLTIKHFPLLLRRSLLRNC